MKLINHLLSLISDHSLIPHDTPTVNWFGPLSPQCCYRLSFPSPCDNKFSFFLFSFFFQFSVFERKEEEKKKSGTIQGRCGNPSQILLSLINNYCSWRGIS